jgi:hypothetical protein
MYECVYAPGCCCPCTCGWGAGQWVSILLGVARCGFALRRARAEHNTPCSSCGYRSLVGRPLATCAPGRRCSGAAEDGARSVGGASGHAAPAAGCEQAVACLRQRAEPSHSSAAPVLAEGSGRRVSTTQSSSWLQGAVLLLPAEVALVWSSRAAAGPQSRGDEWPAEPTCARRGRTRGARRARRGSEPTPAEDT